MKLTQLQSIAKRLSLLRYPSKKKIKEVGSGQGKGVFISLPLPKKEELDSLKSETLQMQYLNTIENIAKLEAETVVEVSRARFSSFWKMALIVGAVTFLLVGLFLGYTIQQVYGGFTFKASPTLKK